MAFRQSWYSIVILSLLVGGGCANETETKPASATSEDGHSHDESDHGHDHAPKTLKEAVEKLVTLRNTTRDAFAKNDTETAHGPLHDVGHVLEAINELAVKEQLSEDNQKAVKASVETLFDAFGAVDKTMHGQEGSTYPEVSSKIDEAVTALLKATGIEVPGNASTAAKSDASASAATSEGAAEPKADGPKKADEEKK